MQKLPNQPERTEKTRLKKFFIVVLLLSIGLMYFISRPHPLLDPLAWKKYPPEQISPEEKDFAPAPFFYAFGSWPLRLPQAFGSKPILWSLPYEKAPPKNFLGKVIGYFEVPDTWIQFEGPKTPIALPIETIRQCLTDESFSRFFDKRCLEIRYFTLSRNLEELEATGFQSIRLEWFEILPLTPVTTTNDETSMEASQGIHLTAENETHFEDRFIWIAPTGRHQVISFHRSKTALGDAAEKLVFRAIRTVRISTELISLRGFIDEELAKSKITPEKSSLDDLMKAEFLLLSKASVEPDSFHAFFHLTNLALYTFQWSARQKWGDVSALSKKTAQSSLRYARDVQNKTSPEFLKRLDLFQLELDKK